MSASLIVGISGSASSQSYNTALVAAAGSLLGERLDFVLASGLEDLPFYTPDLDGDSIPESARRLRELVGRADALIISTPEYNYSTTALLKNAIDWLSRPYGAHVLVDKPVAIMGASQGLLGTVRAQLHLREVLHATNCDVVARPEVFVTQVGVKFNESHELIDSPTRSLLAELVAALLDLAGVAGARDVA